MKKAKTGKWNDYPDISTTSSFTDTTGMMPTPPLTDEQFEAYQDLAGMEIPKQKENGQITKERQIGRCPQNS